MIKTSLSWGYVFQRLHRFFFNYLSGVQHDIIRKEDVSGQDAETNTSIEHKFISLHRDPVKLWEMRYALMNCYLAELFKAGNYLTSQIDVSNGPWFHDEALLRAIISWHWIFLVCVTRCHSLWKLFDGFVFRLIGYATRRLWSFFNIAYLLLRINLSASFDQFRSVSKLKKRIFCILFIE